MRSLSPIVASIVLISDPAFGSVAPGRSANGAPPAVIASQEAGVRRLALPGGEVFHETADPIVNLRIVPVPGSATVLVLWDEVPADGSMVPHYAVSLDGRTLAGRVRETSYAIRLRYASFDPLEVAPAVNPALRAGAANNLYLVQFWTVPLEEFRTGIERLGGEVVRFIANHTHIVRMDADVAEQVRRLPYVRWVGPNHIAYKLDDAILSGMVEGMPEGPATYSIEVFDRGPAQQDAVAARIEALGGRVMNTNPEGFRMTVWLLPSQILPVARMDEVHFMDPWGPGGVDVETARLISGALPTLANAGFTGQGVRGEVFDTGIEPHPDFANPDPIFHNGPGGGGHGTRTYGTVFGSGLGNPRATGFLPDREQGISARYEWSSQFGGTIPRHQHTAELVDPNDRWRALFQTSSVGGPRSTQYTTISAETDDYLFISQLLSTQSMSNANLTPQTRPQAWAKNIVGVGRVSHAGTLSRDDDRSAGSTGPAADGRIKPDLVHIPALFTTSGSSGYGWTGGGTSGSTANTAGCFGLFFQMWHEGVFPGHGGGASVFDSRAKMATAKAMMINTAFRYDWYSPGVPTPNTNMWRDRQGWGMPDVGTMYEMRHKMMIIDETDIILPLQTNSYDFRVDPGEPELNVTMVYTDPKGTPGAAVHRINDLSLRVTSPSGVSYWGNNGLRDTNWSTPGGLSNTVDTVENVFIRNPEPGGWLIEVIADEIVEDSHVETPALDADYALVASGGQEVRGVAIRLVSMLPTLVPPATPVDLTVSITEGHSSIVAGTEEYHYRFDGGAFTTASLTPLGNEEYMATIPAGECGDLPEYYFSVEDAQSGTVFLPTNGAAAPFSYDIGELATSTEFAEGFEGGSLPSGWTATGLWNITSSCSPAAPCDGSFFAYFGKTSTCNYNTGARATGSLTSPLIAVPSFNPMGGATLSYCYTYERESNPTFDKARVLINGELVDEPAPTNTWETRQIDLAKYAGQDIRVEFFFDTTDGFNNNFRGWQVDRIELTVTDLVCDGCYPDCDGDGILDILDFLCFQNSFVAGEPYACDCDPDPACDIFDFLCFQSAFVAGCP